MGTWTLLANSTRNAGTRYSTSVSIPAIDNRVWLRLTSANWTPDEAATIEFGVQRSHDNGATWEPWMTVVTHVGARSRSGDLPSLSVPLYADDLSGDLVRGFILTAKRCNFGIQAESVAGSRPARTPPDHHSWAATARKNEATAGGVDKISTLALNSSVAGNFIAVGSAVYRGGGTSTCAVSDATNGAYSQSFYCTSGTLAAGLHYFPNNAGGNLTITIDPASTNNDMWVCVHEFSGGATSSPASGTPSTGTGSAYPIDPGDISPPDDDVLVIAVCLLDRTTSITENYGGEGFTLSNEHESTSNAEAGSMVYKIVSGDPGTLTHTWDMGQDGDWRAGIAAFKPAGGAAPPLAPKNSLLLMGVGR